MRSDEELEWTCIRKRVIVLKQEGYTQSVAFKQLKAEGYDASMRIVKNNWNKTMNET